MLRGRAGVPALVPPADPVGLTPLIDVGDAVPLVRHALRAGKTLSAMALPAQHGASFERRRTVLRPMMTHCWPRLFMYDLGNNFRDDAPTDRSAKSSAVSGFWIDQNRSFLHHVGQYSLGDVVLYRAWLYRCLTSDPALADIFFIPAYSSRFASAVSREPHNESLFDILRSSRLPDGRSAFERANGADHFIIQPRAGAWYERGPTKAFDYADRSFMQTIRLSTETPFKGNPLPYQPESMYIGVPWPSPVRDGVPWQSTRTRTRLVCASMGIHGTHSVRKLRTSLKNDCEKDARCTLLRPSGKNEDQIYEEYLRSVFCLNPPGDSISRRAIVDSTLLGCIPVLFHRGQALQWPWHWSWGVNASVLLPWTSNSSVIDALAAIPQDRVRFMQETIRTNAVSLAYRTYDAPDDAFAIILRKVASMASRAIGQKKNNRS